VLSSLLTACQLVIDVAGKLAGRRGGIPERAHP
jgi:hypothetical protein